MAKQNNAFERIEMPKKEAVSYFFEKNDEYKLDLLHGLEDGKINFLQTRTFTDRKTFSSTGHIKAIKLTNTAGAYWKAMRKIRIGTRVIWCNLPKVINYWRRDIHDHDRRG